jgi:ABC-type dipeptide/oligopeptide/nickel transport system permease subunit
MGRFLRENWIWIIAPIVIIAVLCLVIAWISTKEQPKPIQYPF